MKATFKSVSSYWKDGVYLPTAGGFVLLACAVYHYSLVVDLKEHCTALRNSGSFKNSIGLIA
jgi:hypothetical protein